MEDKERKRIAQIIVEYDDIRLQLMAGDAEDILQATKTGIGFMLEELNDSVGIIPTERSFQKGDLSIASEQFEQAMKRLAPMLKVVGRRHWPDPISHCACDYQSEKLFFEELENIEKDFPNDKQRKEYVCEKLIPHLEKELNERTIYFSSLIELIKSFIEKGHWSSKPCWNRDIGRLCFKGQIVKTIANVPSATNVVCILDEFEREGWPDRIDNPFPGANADKLKDGIRSLNGGLKLLGFRQSSHGVAWQEL